MPIHARIEAEEGREAARRFAGEAFAVLCLAALALVAVVEAAAGAVVLLLAAGYAGDPGMLDLATWLTRLAFPMVAASLAAAFLGAVLTAERRPLPAALAPLVVNLVLLAALAVLALRPDLTPETRAAWLAGAVSAAGLAQLAVVAAAIQGRSSLAWRRPRLSPRMGRLLALGGPALAASGAAPLMILAATQVASFTPSAVSWLYYADRLVGLPLGFVGVAVGLVLLPEVAAREAAGDRAGFREAQNRALEAALLLALPAALALGILAYPIARVLFERGAFGPEDSVGTALALAGLSPGLPFAAAGKVLSQALFAQARGRAALVAGGFGLVVTAAGALLLGELLGVLGIGLGASLGLAAHAGALALLLRPQELWAGDARLRERALRMGGACLAMGAALYGLRDLAEAGLGPVGPGPADALLLAGFCLAGLAVYAGAALLLGAVTPGDLRRLRGRP